MQTNKKCEHCGKPVESPKLNFCKECLILRQRLLTTVPELIELMNEQMAIVHKTNIALWFMFFYMTAENLTSLLKGPLWLEAFFIVGSFVALLAYPLCRYKENRIKRKTSEILENYVRNELNKNKLKEMVNNND